MKQKNDPILSVIVPVYNTQEYLAECIKSILNQTFTDLELILVDDGSTDSSGLICDKYEALDNRIRVIHKENTGMSLSRLAGVKCAKGKYISFVDSDDFIDENMYERMMACSDNADVIISGIYRYFDDEHIIEHSLYMQEGFYTRTDIENKIISNMIWDCSRDCSGLDPSLCSKLHKRNLLEKYLEKTVYKGFYGGDMAVVYPLMLECDSVYILDENFYYHRQRSGADRWPYVVADDYFDNVYSLYNYLGSEIKKSKYSKSLMKQLERLYIYMVNLKNHCFADYNDETISLFPYWKLGQSSRVVLYGSGNIGKNLFSQNRKFNFCNIVLWVDKNYKNYSDYEEKISPIEDIEKTEFDYIVIAVSSLDLAAEIKNSLVEKGISAEKIIWVKGNTIQL